MSGGVLNTGLRQRTGVTRESENDASRPASLDADALLAASARRQRLLSFWPVFATLALANACSAFFNIIGDCDETYNYWEPTHYLVNDFGMQTWEYSSEFALRSYAYLSLHAVPAFLLQALTSNKVLTFYLLRVLLALVCAACQAALCIAVQLRFGSATAKSLRTLMVFSTGMFIASTAYLASSFSMYCLMLAISCWFSDRPRATIMIVFASSFLGWPFASACLAPVALDIIYQYGLVQSLLWGLQAALLVVAPIVLIDAAFYGRFVVPAVNIVYYNVLDPNTSSELYGVAPLSFYVKNLALNFNVALPLAALALPLLFLARCCVPTVMDDDDDDDGGDDGDDDNYDDDDAFIGDTHDGAAATGATATEHVADSVELGSAAARAASPPPATVGGLLRSLYLLTPAYLWLAIMLPQPHKEERFLFVVYPLLCLCAAVGLHSAVVLSRAALPRALAFLPSLARSLLLGSFAVLSLSRSTSLVLNYSAPLRLWEHFHGLVSDAPTTVCVGQEWHRFPNSFFLPRADVSLQFVEAGFHGLLPKPFAPFPHGVREPASDMNRFNREVPQRYVDAHQCDYLVDLRRADDASVWHWRGATWHEVTSVPFYERDEAALDDERPLDKLARLFYIPPLSHKHVQRRNYVLWRRAEPAASE